MALRSKILCTLCIIVALYLILGFAIHRFFISPSYIELERNEAKKDIKRCIEALRREVHHLDMFTNDWAAWDDTYQFVRDSNGEYIRSNLVLQTFVDNRLNIIYFCDSKGSVIWGKVYDPVSKNTLSLAQFPEDYLPITHPLLQHKSKDSSITGVLSTELGPVLIASRPIINSDRQGPVLGSLIMGKFIDKLLLESLVDQTRIDFRVWPVTSDSMPLRERGILKDINAGDSLLITEHEDTLNAYAIFPDISGIPALLIRADINREISAKGTAAMRFTLVSNVAAGIILLAVLWVLIQRIIIKPVSDLTRDVIAIRDLNDLPQSFALNRNDEIGLLSCEFDRMVKQLAGIQHNLEKLVKDRTADLVTVNRQLKKEIGDRIVAENTLKKTHGKLEQQVKARTAELVETNEQLKLEIEERKRSENELRIYHARLRSLSSELLLTEERERRRIATELHDRIGQALTISRIKIDSLIESACSQDACKDLEKIGELIEQTIQDARLLTFELSPPVLYELGLEAALEWLTEQVQRQHGLLTEFDDDLQPKPLNHIFRVFLFQATRELLFNVVKHARAKKVTVSVKRAGDEMRIEVKDDGIGFDIFKNTSPADKNVGFGLFSIRERFHHLGGHLEVESEPGEGTRVILISPTARQNERNAA